MLLNLEERKKVYTFRYRDLPENMPATEYLSPKSETTKSDAPLISPPTKPAAVKRKRSTSTTEKKPVQPKKSKFTSVKSYEAASPSVASAGHAGDDPFEFDEPGIHFYIQTYH